jgi:hypothetical protein
MISTLMRVTLVAILLVAGACARGKAAAAVVNDGEPCIIRGQGAFGGQGVLINGRCVPAAAGNPVGTSPVTRVIDCGRPQVHEIASSWNPVCGKPIDCVLTDKVTGATRRVNAMGTETKINGRWSKPVVWCPAQADPVATVADIRDEAIRLLPPVQPGKASTDPALVNTETIFWAATQPNRTLPTATVVGERVQLRTAFDSARWDFGDGATDETTDAGRVYDEAADPCDTVHCPDYYTHTYTTTGPMRVSLTVTWRASYRVAGGAWADLDDPITGPPSTIQVRLYQARGVLVSAPGRHG